MVSQKDIDDFVRTISEKMVGHIRVKYGCPKFNPTVSVIFAAHRKRSRGGVRNGKAFFYIIGKKFLAAAQGTGMMNVPEYKSFNRDSDIGGLYNVSWKKGLASLVAHELSHSVQYDQGTKAGAKRVLGIEDLDDRNSILTGHDWFWKRIYADLRVQFVNGNQFEIETAKPVAPVPVPKPAPAVSEPAQPRAGTLYVKYAYKGNSTVTRFYIDQKLKAVIVETNRQFFKADEFGDVQEKLPFTTLAECRRFLIGM